MTEAEWLACTDPLSMLDFLSDKTNARKLRLFAVACCRRVCHLLPKVVRKLVQASERYADGLIGEEVFRQQINRNSIMASMKPESIIAANLSGAMVEYGETSLAR